MSLAGVAQDDVSRTAIFLIETGKSHPTLPTLELIAERTGKPVEYFLDDEPQPTGPAIDFLEIEQILAREDFDRVKELTGALLQSRLSRADTARLRLLKGISHIRRADAEEAEPLLRAAREHYEAIGDQASAVECLSWEVHIPFLLEDPEALAIAESALARCRNLKPVPTNLEARILGRIAGIHAFNRNWARAIVLFEELVALYGSLRNLGRMAEAYGELGSAYREMGQLDVSARYTHKSLALHEMLRDGYSTAIAENNLALALMNMRDYGAAQEHLNRSMALFDDLGRERGKSHVLLSLAELKLCTGELEEAERYGSEGLELARRLGERATEAEGHRWLGQVAAAQGDAASTDARFASAISRLQKLGLTERLVRTHAAYAEILEDRGDMQAANHHLRQVLAMSRPDLVSTRRERAEQSALG